MVPTQDGSAFFEDSYGGMLGGDSSTATGQAPTGSPSQQWTAAPFGGSGGSQASFQIRNVDSGKCLDVTKNKSGQVYIGAKVLSYTCHTSGTTGDSQAWSGNSSGQIINATKAAGGINLCLDVDADSNDVPLSSGALQLSTCAYNPAAAKRTVGQIWTETRSLSTVAIRRSTNSSSGATNLQVDTPTAWNNSDILMQNTTGYKSQSWNYLFHDDGTLSFINVISGYCLDIYGGNLASGTKLVQYGCHMTSDSTDSQRWINIGKLGAGQYMSAKSLATDAKGALVSDTPMCIQAGGLKSTDADSRKPNAPVIVAPCGNSDQQMFTIVGN